MSPAKAAAVGSAAFTAALFAAMAYDFGRQDGEKLGSGSVDLPVDDTESDGVTDSNSLDDDESSE